MMKSIHIRSIVSVAAVLLLTLVVSCNKFEYAYDENNPGVANPNESLLNFTVSWDKANLASGHKPENVTVLMGRKVNSLHYAWNLDGNGAFIFPEEPEDSEATETPESSETPEVPEADQTTTPVISKGEYYAIAFSDDAHFYNLSSYEQFAQDVSVSMTELYAEVPAIPDEEVSQDRNFIDFNAYAGFIKHADEPLYMDIMKNVSCSSNETSVVITPTNLTRTLTFKLLSRSEEGVTVDGISAVLSGVATKVQLMSGLMTRSNTAKLAFELTKCGKESVEEKDKVVEYDVYEGSVKLLGVFSSDDRAYITGPGIFQVAVTASVTDNGKHKQRVFHAGLNLKPILDELELMVLSDDKTGYTMKPQNQISKIAISTPLHVMKNQILASDTEGLVQWKDNDVEIMPEEKPEIIE